MLRYLLELALRRARRRVAHLQATVRILEIEIAELE